jgi:hypothetical protein
MDAHGRFLLLTSARAFCEPSPPARRIIDYWHFVHHPERGDGTLAAIRPKVVVGGYPVKAGLIRSIPAANLMADTNSLALN